MITNGGMVVGNALDICQKFKMPNGLKENDLKYLSNEIKNCGLSHLKEIGFSTGKDESAFWHYHAWVTRWVNCGMPVFRLNESLLSGLFMTDPSKVLINEFHPTFDSILIYLP